MDSKTKYVIGNMLAILGASIIAAACKNLELVEGIVLAAAAVLLFLGAWMSATVKAQARL